MKTQEHKSAMHHTIEIDPFEDRDYFNGYVMIYKRKGMDLRKPDVWSPATIGWYGSNDHTQDMARKFAQALTVAVALAENLDAQYQPTE